MATLDQDEQAALRDELLRSVSNETRALLLVVLDETYRTTGLQVAVKDRGQRIGKVLRVFRHDAKGDAFHVMSRVSGLTWGVRMPEINRGRITRIDVENVFGSATSGRASDGEITVRLDTVDDVRRMLSFIKQKI